MSTINNENRQQSSSFWNGPRKATRKEIPSDPGSPFVILFSMLRLQ